MEQFDLPSTHLSFPPFRFDPANASLWKGSQVIPLRPKTFAVLHYLLTRAGQLVTKDELLKALWSGLRVSETLPKDSVVELRKAFGDDPREPRFIETVHGRGYRFIAPLTTASPVSGSHLQVSGSANNKESQQRTTWSLRPETSLVGRHAELLQLRKWLEKADNGKRQVIFVTGEPGIGKTALVETFLKRLSPRTELLIGRGQCIEQYGAGEAYLPVLDAFGLLCRGPEGNLLAALLKRYAPTWLVQMPWLLDETDQEWIRRQTRSSTQERMLREIAMAIEALTAEKLLILWLEDLHWSDHSTLAMVSFLARRQEPTRFLLLGTYRPGDVLLQNHPLQAVKQELQTHGYCRELPLEGLTKEEVTEYVATRLAAGAHNHALLQRLAKDVHLRTEGNPLFMVNVVDNLTTQDVFIKSGKGKTREVASYQKDTQTEMPENLRQMIEQHLSRLNLEQQRLLEVASVAGMEFSAAAVATGLATSSVDCEHMCEDLVRRKQFLRATGVEARPDGTTAGRYSFLHSLYQNVCYERTPAGWRQQLHRQIGEAKAQGYGSRAGEIATELTMHFEAGQAYQRAIEQRKQAADNALRRYAYQEALDHLRRGLDLLQFFPNPNERAQQELALQLALTVPLSITVGYATPPVEAAVLRAQQLCQQVGTDEQHCWALAELGAISLLRGELRKSREIAERVLPMAQRLQNPLLLISVHQGLGEILFFQGELSAARAHLEQGVALSHYSQHHPLTFAHDPGVLCHSLNAWVLCELGYFDQAVQNAEEGITLAKDVAHPHTLAFALNAAASVYLLLRKAQVAHQLAKETLVIAQEQRFPFWLMGATLMQGWALIELGQHEQGLAQIQEGLSFYHNTGATSGQTAALGFLAVAYGKVGRINEGLTILDQALALMEQCGEWVSEPMLYLIKGELLLQPSTSQPKSGVINLQILSSKRRAEAERCFLHCLEAAHRQSAKFWELRATMSLTRLWRQQGEQHAARNMLSAIYNWFTEGFDTKDLQEAQALLEELDKGE